MLKDKDTALIVIDVQNDFCPGGALAVAGGDDIVAPINQMIDRAASIILTQDWHPADHASFASMHKDKNPFDLTEMPYGQQVLWPDHCVIGSAGAEFHPELNSHAAQTVIRKGFRTSIDSYSAFFENDQKTVTGLDGYLKARNISKLVMCGLATDYCVAFSARDAVRCGYQVEIVLPACRAIDLDGSLHTQISAMKAEGVVLREGLVE